MRSLASMSEVTLQENVMEFLDDVHRYLIGLVLCAVAMLIVWGLWVVLSVLLDVFIGDRKWK